jgi:ABC-type branched-subunit amino acid transport system ATPase component
VIEVEGLTVRFAGITPIDDMSVVFPEGTCGLIGPNGAGKTTFFNVLSGFVKPAAGSITAFGQNLLKLSDYKRAVGGCAAPSRPRWRSSSSPSSTTSH